MEIFKDFDVYNHNYSYEEMKVMGILSQMEESKNLDYEQMMIIVEAVFRFWAEQGLETKEYSYSWLEIQGRIEEGYIQEYATRTLPKFIELFDI